MNPLGIPSSTKLYDAIKAIPPERISVFLREQRWTRDKPWKGKGYDWILPTGEYMLVPSDPAIPHYSQAMVAVFEMFISSRMLFEDVMVMATFGTCDIFRRSIDEPNTQSGSCSLEEARSEIVGLKELLLWSSRRYAMKTANVSRLASSYLEQCRAGQTEFGSYVLKVYAPIQVAGSPPEQPVFGREVTIAAAENVTYFAAEDYNPEHPLPPSMDWHVAEAILRMKSAAGFWGEGNELSIRLVDSAAAITAALEPPQGFTERDGELVIPMNGQLFSRAEAVYETLKSGELLERRVFTGHITDLHKDEPGGKQQDQRITIRTLLDGKARNITMRLISADYKRAVVWHDKEDLVQVDAKIDKRWRVWTAPEYHHIGALVPERGDGPQLFT